MNKLTSESEQNRSDCRGNVAKRRVYLHTEPDTNQCFTSMFNSIKILECVLIENAGSHAESRATVESVSQFIGHVVTPQRRLGIPFNPG